MLSFHDKRDQKYVNYQFTNGYDFRFFLMKDPAEFRFCLSKQ